WNFKIGNVKGESWSPGATAAQIDRCWKATDAYNLMNSTAQLQRDAMQAALNALYFQNLANFAQFAALPKRMAAAQARKEAADARVPVARRQRDAQVLTARQGVQAAL